MADLTDMVRAMDKRTKAVRELSEAKQDLAQAVRDVATLQHQVGESSRRVQRMPGDSRTRSQHAQYVARYEAACRARDAARGRIRAARAVTGDL